MKKISTNANVQVEFTITLNLTPGEASALNAISVYGADAFLKVFYEKLGRAYVEPYEKDLRALLAKLRTTLPPELRSVNKANKAISEVLQPFKQ